MNLNIYTMLERTPDKVNKEIIDYLIQHGESKAHKEGDLIVKEGDASDKVYIILDGTADITKPDSTRHEVVIATLEKGSIFGEMGIFVDQKRSANVRAKTVVKAIAVPNKNFLDALFKFPLFTLRLIKSLTGRISNLNIKFMDSINARNMLFMGMTILEEMRSMGDAAQDAAINLPLFMQQTQLDANTSDALMQGLVNAGAVQAYNIDGDKLTVTASPAKLVSVMKKMSLASQT